MESQNKNKPITFFSFDSNVLAHGIGFNMTLQKKKRHPSNGDFAAYGVHRHCWVCNPTNIHKIQWFTIRCGGKEYRSIGLSERGKMPYSIILGTTEGQSYTIFSELQRINDAKTMEKFDIYLSPKRKTLAPPVLSGSFSVRYIHKPYYPTKLSVQVQLCIHNHVCVQ